MNMVKLLKIGYLKLISQQYEQQYLFFVYIKIACITKGIMFYICHPMILSAMLASGHIFTNRSKIAAKCF